MKINWNLIFGTVMTLIVCVIASAMEHPLSWPWIIGLFLVSYPWQFGENVYSLWGGYSEEGSIYSLFGVFQIAKEDAVQVFGISILQFSFNGESLQFLGFSFI